MGQNSDFFVEAHSYAGGLKFTSFARAGGRPSWAPPADSVGWHDEFSFGSDDTVIEISKRVHLGEELCWVGVFRRSIDTKFGDRGNHAGIGIWLRNYRIADAQPLLSALFQFAVTLARQPDPDLLAGQIAEFSTARFLQSYLVEADRLPGDWSGVQGSADALLTTTNFEVLETDFDQAAHRVAGLVVRWSLGWDRAQFPPRALIRVATASSDDRRPDFRQLEQVDTVMADIILRVPQACAASLDAEISARKELEKREADFQRERAEIQRRWDEERVRLESIDGKPATLEGVARLLNRLAADLSDLKATRLAPPAPIYNPAPVQRTLPRRSTVGRVDQMPDYRSGSGGPDWVVYAGVVFILIMVAAIIYMLWDKFTF